jgi:hypothetical protein
MKINPIVMQSALQNFIASLPYRIARDEVPEAYGPDSWCTMQDGMGKILKASQSSRTRRLSRRQ